MPGHVAIGDQLTVDVASDLRVPPAIVDVNNADHVPLKVQRQHGECKLEELFQFAVLRLKRVHMFALTKFETFYLYTFSKLFYLQLKYVYYHFYLTNNKTLKFVVRTWHKKKILYLVFQAPMIFFPPYI